MRLKLEADPYVYGSTNDLLDSRGQHRRVEAAHPQCMWTLAIRQGIVSGTAGMGPGTAHRDRRVLHVGRKNDCANECAPNASRIDHAMKTQRKRNCGAKLT
jgi:hypothetical protein